MKNFRKVLLSTAVVCVGMGFGVAARAESADLIPGDFTANVTLASDYVFRGITQSDENPAIQGGFDYSFGLTDSANLYLGVWASNVDFNDGDEANIEIDYYGGLNYTLDKWTFDGGVIYYSYPGADDNLDYDFVEVQGKVGYNFDVVALTGSINYSPEFFGETGDAWYYKLAASAPLPKGFGATAYVGHQDVEDSYDYTDWGVGVGYSIEGLDFGLNYIDTDIDDSDCADGCDDRVVLSVGKKF